MFNNMSLKKINAFDNHLNQAYRESKLFLLFKEQNILSEIDLKYDTASSCNCINIISHHFNSTEFFFLA